MKLHLGCGTNKKDGWVNIDSVADCNPDQVLDLTKPLPYDDLSVDEILAEDLLEHFDKYFRFIVFSHWMKVLKVGGVVTLQVPNFKKMLFRYFKFKFDSFVDCLFGENLWNSEIYLGHFGNHKWGYSTESLKKFVSNFGIVPTKIYESGLNIRFVGKKEIHIEGKDLDKIEIFSHANQFGPGPDTVTLKFIKERIDQFNRSNKK